MNRFLSAVTLMTLVVSAPASANCGKCGAGAAHGHTAEAASVDTVVVPSA